jgi:type II secretory pathway pseudopilin PulG
MRGKIRAFTLVELLVAVLISTLVVLGLVSVYRSVQDVRNRLENYEQNRRLYELIYLLQKELSNCRDLELSGDTLHYYTTLGISAPYVMVNLSVQKGSIIYTESNPYDPSITYLRRQLRVSKNLKMESYKDKGVVRLFYGDGYVDLLVLYNKVPTSSIFLKPF